MKLSYVLRSALTCLAFCGLLLLAAATDARAGALSPQVASPLSMYRGPVPDARAVRVDSAMAMRAWVECVNRYNAHRLHTGVHIVSAWMAQPPLTVLDICGDPPPFPERVVVGSWYGGVPVGRGPWK